jgi:RHS repeat-associated protein
VEWGREFRYDGARQRYLNAVLDPDYLELGGVRPMPGVAPVWSDYDGDGVYGDFTVTPGYPPTVAETESFELGVGKFSWSGGAPDTLTPEYYHTDMIGTTRFMSNAIGNQLDPGVYTAFAERINGTNHRYGYAGAWGYQAHDEFPFLHVGHRYYDPSTGRFLQRDPIGIVAALNVYEYVRSRPLNNTDSSGLWDEGMSDWEVWEDPFDRYPGWGEEDDFDESFRKGVRKVGALACLLAANPWSNLPRSWKWLVYLYCWEEWFRDW